MRITAGALRGQKILAPRTAKTRPMTDEMREAIFNVLGPVDDFKVLDVYAGSGAIGLEALSRGAASVEAVEISGKVGQIIKRNLENLGVLDRYQLYIGSIERWVKKHEDQRGEYDLIFVDPPFDSFNPEVAQQLAKYLQPKGLLELRTSTAVGEVVVPGLKPSLSKTYGDSLITFYTLKNVN